MTKLIDYLFRLLFYICVMFLVIFLIGHMIFSKQTETKTLQTRKNYENYDY
jgi:hypothetical protein